MTQQPTDQRLKQLELKVEQMSKQLRELPSLRIGIHQLQKANRDLYARLDTLRAAMERKVNK